MGFFDWVLELSLVGLLAFTLVRAIRLERALQTLRQDRDALGQAIAGLDTSSREAEAGIGKLHAATTDTVQSLSQRLDKGNSLRDDLQFLIDRGETLADRLEISVRTVRGAALASPAPVSVEPPPKVRSQAERDLLLALRAGQ